MDHAPPPKKDRCPTPGPLSSRSMTYSVRTAIAVTLGLFACAAPGPRANGSKGEAPKAQVAAQTESGIGGRALDANGDALADEFSPVTQTYLSKTVGFSMKFDPTWLVWAHQKTMPPQMQVVSSKMRESGAEVLLFARTKDNLRWLRITAEETDIALEQYFALIRQVNAKDISLDEHEVTKLGNGDAVRWTFQTQVNGMPIKYQEYQVKRGPFNLRISFWTALTLFDALQGDFARVGGTYTEL